MSAERLAAALEDLRAGRWMNMETRHEWSNLPERVADWTAGVSTVVDLTPVFDGWIADGIDDLYAATVMPVWNAALVGYHNARQNVTRLGLIIVTAGDEVEPWPFDETAGNPPYDWSQVAWVHSMMAFVWSEHTPHGRGPLVIYRIATTDDGKVLDVHWTDIADSTEGGTGPSIHLVATVLRAYDLLACRNVDLVEPPRPRPTRRRIDRASPGVRISELAIFPRGAWSRARGDARPLSETATALHTVRGHFAEYGTNGKGLLFGRIAGRFFIPQHVRGSAEHGETLQIASIHDDQEATG